MSGPEHEISAAFEAFLREDAIARLDASEDELNATLARTRTLTADIDTDEAWRLYHALIDVRRYVRETVERLSA